MVRRVFAHIQQVLDVIRQWNIYHVFLEREYQRHTIARLEHLDSLGLDIRGKRVLEVGAGIGEHTLFYLHRGCEVVVTDGRPELVRFIRNRLGVPTHVLDVETELDKLYRLGKFDILHCYGLLYHISNPEAFLEHTARVTNWLFLETCVSAGNEQAVRLLDEERTHLWEAVHGQGCLPTRAWLFHTLRRFYPYVYCPTTQPYHEQFPIDWEAVPETPTRLIRAIFIASHQPINNPILVEHLPMRYEA